MSPLASAVRHTTFSGLLAYSALGWGNDASLARDFAECSEITDVVAKLSKKPAEQEIYRKSSLRFRVYARALSDAEFVELERTKVRHDLTDLMLSAIRKADVKEVQDHLTRKVTSCLELLQKNEEFMRPKVKQLYERLKAENQL